MNGVFGWILRIVLVVGLLGAAAAVATPKGRLPLALRGIRRIMRRDAGLAAGGISAHAAVSGWRRLAAFVLVILAALSAVARCRVPTANLPPTSFFWYNPRN